MAACNGSASFDIVNAIAENTNLHHNIYNIYINLLITISLLHREMRVYLCCGYKVRVY